MTEETKLHLVRICQAVDGLPLGLELAASWLRALSCEEIADELTQNLDLLETNMRNVPERHRSIRFIFEQTWQQLSARERAALGALSIFRGGCTREAARNVVGAPLPLIVQLVDKSLLQHTAAGRYQMHELFRQYAFEQMQETPDEHERLLRKLSDYFIDYIHAQQADYEQALAYFAESIRLCRATNNLVDESFALTLSVDAHVAVGDGNAALEAGRAGDQILTELGLVEHRKVRGNLLAEALRVNSQFDEAEKLHFIALQRAEEVGEESIVADTYRRLGRLAWARHDYHKAEEYLSQSIALSRKNDNKLTFVYSLCDLGLMLIDADVRREDEIRAYLQEALQLALELSLVPVAMDTFLGTGILNMGEGHVDSALELLSFVEQHSASTYAPEQKHAPNLPQLMTSFRQVRLMRCGSVLIRWIGRRWRND